jgi:hypothetical protein
MFTAFVYLNGWTTPFFYGIMSVITAGDLYFIFQ